ncbi:MAG: patatin-like phospholipase family protein [Zoogloeaceae bacterium]|nr:patatin-like phospholipase family protein [Zoogloeaceae bacterium]
MGGETVLMTRRPPKVGLALGSGSARGWAHLGVIQALAEQGIRPDVICGCSIGAFVGAAVAGGDQERLHRWAESLRWKDVLALMDVSLRGGLIKGARLMDFFERNFEDRDFSALDTPFACVATDLPTGREVWLREGSVSQAVRASIALPGLMTPIPWDDTLLVDGGLVNPVPVSLCRAMGADLVVAVDLGSDIVGRPWRREVPPLPQGEESPAWPRRLLSRLGIGNGEPPPGEPNLPSIVGVLVASINIMQVRIARSRLAGEPADVLLSPRVGHVGPLDYHRAAETISEGVAEVQRMLPAIHHAFERFG